MIKYKVIFEGDEQDELFDSWVEAKIHALYLCSRSREGVERLRTIKLPDCGEDDGYEYEIIEVAV